MPISNTLQRSLNVASIFIRSAPLSGVNGVANEPGLSIGDQVRQFILGAPFAWRWNRNTRTFTLTAGQQDYTQTISDFGWLEKASVTDGAGNIQELLVELNLGTDVTPNMPIRISVFNDNNNGTITFRFLPTPDKNYTVNMSYQKLAPSFAALTDTWAPIPDYMFYLYNVGVQAFTYGYLNDVRYLPTLQVFVKQVVAANGGLDDTQKNIFLADFINTKRDETAQMGKSQSGTTGRGLFG